ncbi:isoamyl acetate-hydrolyzing esterase 1 homolog [Oppia nitens]|uniref:isoamyl acetate-hydrolyzing esterase 1 homolog n=1 Tax=Oppia nitens TaxID=1686743 RepID=UPI0023DCBA92|nr:isoamyl acetate-hydrolyzing esterase 1 homolog [Oppia nitens]
MANNWNRVILFGDSLTQRAFEPQEGCWGSLIADRLQRISDVIVRGFSGYNSRYLRMIGHKVFPPVMNFSDVSCVTILLGANDANDIDSPSGQHVPINEFEDNLTAIVNHLETIGITKDKIIMISPPIYCHHKWVMFCNEKKKPISKKDNQTVGKYAEAVVRVAQTNDIEFLDIYKHFSEQPNHETLLCDGLHFSRKGSQLMFELIWPLIETRIKRYNQCSQLVMNFPIYSDIDTKCPSNTLLP